MDSLPKKTTTMREQIEKIRRDADLMLEKDQGKPASEKAKLDKATLDALEAVKH